MASILDSLSEALKPNLLGQFSKTLGLDGPSTTKGLDVVGPLLTSAMASTASTPKGLDNLMGIVAQVGGSSTPSDLMKMVSGGASTHILSSLFGSGATAVGGTIDRALGFKASSLLGVAAPFIISQLSQRVSAGGLDKNAVAQLLRDEQSTLVSSGSKTGELIQQALQAGHEASATRARYSSDQWDAVRLGPIATASLIASASRPGSLSTAKSVGAMSNALATLKESSSPSSLFSLAAAADITADELKALPSDRPALLGLVGRSVGTVRANSAIEAAVFGQFLVELATRIAEQTKDGGLLGLGGMRINEAERSTIDQIRMAVGQGTGAAL